MPAYNISQLQASDTLYKLFQYANDSTGQVLMGMLMFSIFFIMLLVLKKWDFDKAILASSFSCFILSLILAFAKLLNFQIALLFLIIMAFSALWAYMQR